MNIRVILAVVGLAVAVVSAILLGLRGATLGIQLCLAFGFSTGFIAIGCEHFFRESPILSSYRSRRASIVIGCVFVAVGVGVLALVTGNLMARAFVETGLVNTLSPSNVGAAHSAPRLQFCGLGFSIHVVAGGAALTGAVADLQRQARSSAHGENRIHHHRFSES